MERIDHPTAILSYHNGRDDGPNWLRIPRHPRLYGILGSLAVVASALIGFAATTQAAGPDPGVAVGTGTALLAATVFTVMYFGLRGMAEVGSAAISILLLGGIAAGGFFAGDALNNRDDRLLFGMPLALVAPTAAALLWWSFRRRWRGMAAGTLVAAIVLVLLALTGLLLVIFEK